MRQDINFSTLPSTSTVSGLGIYPDSRKRLCCGFWGWKSTDKKRVLLTCEFTYLLPDSERAIFEDLKV